MNNHEANHDKQSLAGKYLTFKLGDEYYGLEILKVREIIGMMDITKVPHTPPFIKGVINLRGRVIPVIDMRMKFGLPEQEVTKYTCIIVVEIKKKEKAVSLGIIVDAVSEVVDITEDQIDPPPQMGSSVDTRFILGMAKLKSGVKILLDIQKTLSDEDVSSLMSFA